MFAVCWNSTADGSAIIMGEQGCMYICHDAPPRTASPYAFLGNGFDGPSISEDSQIGVHMHSRPVSVHLAPSSQEELSWSIPEVYINAGPASIKASMDSCLAMPAREMSAARP